MEPVNHGPHPFQTASLGALPTGEGASNRQFLQISYQPHTGNFDNEQIAGLTPSPAQQAAINILLPFDIQVALAWLTVLRVHGEFQSWPLASHQIAAFRELKELPHWAVEGWLHDACRLAKPSTPQGSSDVDSQQAAIWPTPGTLQNPPTDATTRFSIVSGYTTSSVGQGTDYSTPPSSCAQRNSQLDSLSDIPNDEWRLSSSTSVGHPHGCPLCEKDRKIRTCDGWKRHMKEHETIYPCNLCAPRSYSRRVNLLKHLETHGFSNDAGSALADTWKRTVMKKYFSCWFCICLFPSITEQLSHIDMKHFRNFQTIDEWDINNVISGLLRQPGVSLNFQRKFCSPFSAIQNLRWNLSVAKDLQLRLELSNEPAEDLADFAFAQIDWTSSAGSVNGTSSDIGYGQQRLRNTQDFSSTLDHVTLINDDAEFIPYVSSPSSIMPMRDLRCLPPSAPGDQSVDLIDRADLYSNAMPGFQQMDSGTRSSFEIDRDIKQDTQPADLSASRIGAAPYVNGALNDGTLSQDSMPPAGVWPLTSFSSPIESNSTPHSIDAANTNNLPSNIIRNMESDIGCSSTTHPTTPTVAHVLSVDAKLKNQRSRRKLVSHYGAPDLDFEELQRLMREHDSSRTAKRHR